MIRLQQLIGLCILTLNAFGGSAPHPSVLTVEYQGKMLPVITFVDRSPVIQVEGSTVVISGNPIYRLQRGERFSNEQVKLVRSMAHTALVRPITEPPRFDSLRVAIELRSQHEIKGGFATIVVFYLNYESGEPEVEQMAVQGLPDLPAGKDVLVKIVAPDTTSDDVQYFLQIFDHTGHEVKTSVMSLAWDYFAMVERAQLKHALKQYLPTHHGEDLDAAAYIRPKPVFESGVPMPVSTVSATLKVSADGTVKGVELSDELDAKTTECISDALYGWLFYPQLKTGTPVPTEVTVTLDSSLIP